MKTKRGRSIVDKKKPTTGDGMWQRAVGFAARRHDRQLCADGKTPFIAHPVRVALTVLTTFQCEDPEVTAAALLHDVIEKTDTTHDEVAAEFGGRVATMVATLSRDYRLPFEKQDQAYFSALLASDWATRLIKLADVHDHLHQAGPEAASRIQKAQQALALATGSKPPIALARRRLGETIAAVGPTCRTPPLMTPEKPSEPKKES